MRITARFFRDIAMTEQLADHRQGLAERPGAGREGVPEIVISVTGGLLAITGESAHCVEISHLKTF